MEGWDCVGIWTLFGDMFMPEYHFTTEVTKVNVLYSVRHVLYK